MFFVYGYFENGILPLEYAISEGCTWQDYVRAYKVYKDLITNNFKYFNKEEFKMKLYFVIKDHPFYDGNKRIGAHAMLIFLLLNGIELKYGQEEVSDLFLNIADSKAGYPETLVWIVQHLS